MPVPLVRFSSSISDRYLQRQRVGNNTVGESPNPRRKHHLLRQRVQRLSADASLYRCRAATRMNGTCWPTSLPSRSPLNRTSKLKRKSEKNPEILLATEKWQPFPRRSTWKPPPLRPAPALPPLLTRTVGCNPLSSWFSISAIPISEKTRFSNFPRWNVVCVYLTFPNSRTFPCKCAKLSFRVSVLYMKAYSNYQQFLFHFYYPTF